MSVSFILCFSLLFIIQCILISVSVCFAVRYKVFYLIHALSSLGCFFMRGLFMLQSDEKIAAVFGAFFLVSEIFFYYSILFFCAVCTDNSQKLKKFLRFFLTVSFADSFLIISNTISANIFTLKSGISFLGKEFFIINPEPLFYIHSGISICLAVFAFLCVGLKLKHVMPVQRKKYNTMFFFSFLFLCIQVIEIVLKKYGIFSALLAFLSSILTCINVISVPRSLRAIIISCVQENSNEAIVCFDIFDHLVFANVRAKEIFASKKIPLDISSIYLFNFFRKNYDPSYDILRWPSIIEINSKIYNYEVIYQKLYNEGVFIGSFFRLKDVTVAHAELEEQRFYATHDHLTGILNRQGFFENVYAVLKNNPDLKYAMACSNIKNFKLINNIFGKEAGNRTLIKTAEMIKKHTHKTSVFARIGEDKFAVFAEKEYLQENRIFSLIESSHFIEENPVYKVIFNIGVYELKGNNERPELALDKALLAMKNSIDNRKIFSFFD